MPKITNLKTSPAETPTQQLVRESVEPFSYTDLKGQLILLQKPGVLDNVRLFEMLGQASSIDRVVGTMMPLTFIKKIDDENITLMNRKQLDALLVRLGDDRYIELVEKIAEHWPVPEEDADKDAIKN